MAAFLVGVSIGGLILFLFILLLGLGLLVWFLAQSDVFFTTVNEGEAKAVVTNGKFSKFLMSYQDQGFDRDWNIIERRRIRLVPRFLRGLRWIGIYPFSKVHLYTFEWTSLEDQPGENGVQKRFKFTQEKQMNHILVQQDTYVTRLDSAECSDNIPLNIVYLITGEVVNPYKALFRVERWLEAAQNLTGASVRHWIGERSYEQIRAAVSRPGGPEMELNEDQDIKSLIDRVRENYGFNIHSIKLYTVDPASTLAEEFIRASTAVYVATQAAEANRVEGAGLRDRAAAYYGTVSGIQGGVEMFKWEQIAKSGLGTYVEGGAKRTTVAVPAAGLQGQPSAAPPPAQAVGPAQSGANP